jgi:predicted O-linked N-acetylglucosamine transferase (SPINDLY family)
VARVRQCPLGVARNWGQVVPASQSGEGAAVAHVRALYTAGRLREAAAEAAAASERFPNTAAIFNISGAASLALGRPNEAERAFRRMLALAPKDAGAHNNLGMALQDLRRHKEALQCFDRAIKFDSGFADAHNNRGVVMSQLGRFDDAVASYRRALEIAPNYVDALNNLGMALQDLDRVEAALESYRRAVALAPDHPQANNNLGETLRRLKRSEEALGHFNTALKAAPAYADAYANLGAALQDLDRFEEAEAACRRALELNPGHADAYANLGASLQNLDRIEEAEAACRSGLAAKPAHAEALNNLGSALSRLGRSGEAIGYFQKAIALKPNYGHAHFNLGNELGELGRRAEAIASLERAVDLDPDHQSARAALLHQQALVCDWEGQSRAWRPRLGVEESAGSPFGMLALEDEPAHHHARAANAVREQATRRTLAVLPAPTRRPDRLRIGYFSPDFRDHPVGTLICRLLELHDRERFSVHAFSFGPATNDAVHSRIMRGVDSFHDIKSLSNGAAAALARSENIDIAVDVCTHTGKNRMAMFALGLAPVQINFMGYPGTSGASFMHYIVADPTVLPPEQQIHFTEKIIYLPHAYHPNDAGRIGAPTTMTRADAGLPERGFVFCCFNNAYKITPREFAIWMRLLQNIPESVLWLLNSNPWMVENLRRAARAHGVDPARLAFAERAPGNQYLERQQLADLFLDTFNYNGHATTIDALSQGLPVLTKLGAGFPARVAGSFLRALDVPELVTDSEAGYEARAHQLASDPVQLKAIRAKLAAHRGVKPLFDTALFARCLERGYDEAHQRAIDAMAPANIWVRPPA